MFIYRHIPTYIYICIYFLIYIYISHLKFSCKVMGLKKGSFLLASELRLTPKKETPKTTPRSPKSNKGFRVRVWELGFGV